MNKLIKEFEKAKSLFITNKGKVGNFRLELRYCNVADYELIMKLPTLEELEVYKYQDTDVDILAAKALIDLREYSYEKIGGY